MDFCLFWSGDNFLCPRLVLTSCFQRWTMTLIFHKLLPSSLSVITSPAVKCQPLESLAFQYEAGSCWDFLSSFFEKDFSLCFKWILYGFFGRDKSPPICSKHVCLLTPFCVQKEDFSSPIIFLVARKNSILLLVYRDREYLWQRALRVRDLEEISFHPLGRAA